MNSILPSSKRNKAVSEFERNDLNNLKTNQRGCERLWREPNNTMPDFKKRNYILYIKNLSVFAIKKDNPLVTLTFLKIFNKIIYTLEGCSNEKNYLLFCRK